MTARYTPRACVQCTWYSSQGLLDLCGFAVCARSKPLPMCRKYKRHRIYSKDVISCAFCVAFVPLGFRSRSCWAEPVVAAYGSYKACHCMFPHSLRRTDKGSREAARRAGMNEATMATVNRTSEA